MFAKILFLILGLGLIGCALLAARQARVQAAHELADTRLRIVRHDAELLRLRALIAERVTPGNVERLAAGILPLAPMLPGVPPRAIADGLRILDPLADRSAIPGGPR